MNKDKYFLFLKLNSQSIHFYIICTTLLTHVKLYSPSFYFSHDFNHYKEHDPLIKAGILNLIICPIIQKGYFKTKVCYDLNRNI